MSKEDLLTEDTPLPKQNYVCLSFLTPERIKGCESKTLHGLKVRGVFNTYEEACEHAKALREKDKDFNVFVGEVGKWLPWDSTEKTEEENYAEKELNDLMKGHKEQIKLGKDELEKRRLEAIESSKKKK
jgi:hypothetical protein